MWRSGLVLAAFCSGAICALAQPLPQAPNSPLNIPPGNYRYDPGSPQGYVPIEPYNPRLEAPLTAPPSQPQRLSPGYGNGIRSPSLGATPPPESVPLPYGNDYRVTVRLAGPRPAKPPSVSRLMDIGPYVSACIDRPDRPGAGLVEATVRVAYTRAGDVLGEPRIVYTTPGLAADDRNRYQQALLTAVSHCAPLPLGANFGAALAGKLILIRFVDDPSSRKGQTPT